MADEEKNTGADTVGEEYISILGMLPTDAQRLVTERLPRLEALVDREVAEYGRQLETYLCTRVRKLAEADGRAADAEMERIPDEEDLTEGNEALDKDARTAMADLRSQLARAESQGGVGARGETGALTASLRASVHQFRRDVAVGAPGEGVGTFRLSLQRWHALDRGDSNTLDKQVQALERLLAESDAAGDPQVAARDSESVASRAREAAGEAGRLNERARQVVTARAGLPESSPEYVARLLAELHGQLGNLPDGEGAGTTDTRDTVRAAVRAAKRAALDLDREVRTTPFRVLTEFADALHKADQPGMDRAPLEEAREACARALAYYNAPGALTEALDHVAGGNEDLQSRLGELAARIDQLEMDCAKHAEEQRRARDLQSGLDRLSHLVDQVEQRLNDRAATAAAETLAKSFGSVRKQVDRLSEATAEIRANADKAVATVSAARRFLSGRKESYQAMCRAIEDSVSAATLPSIGGGDK